MNCRGTCRLSWRWASIGRRRAAPDMVQAPRLIEKDEWLSLVMKSLAEAIVSNDVGGLGVHRALPDWART